MLPTKKLLVPVAAIAALGLISACHNSNSSSPARAGNQAVAQAAPANTDAIAPQSGPVSFAGYAKEDDSPMTADELARTVADVPAIGADYNKLQTATQAQINADGTITLTDSAGNAIDVTPADTTIQSYTFAAVQDSAAVQAYDADSAAAAGQAQAQAQAQAQQQTQEACSAQRLVFDLSGTEQPAASQEQAQAQAQEEKKELKTRGMHVYLLMPCQEVKQEAKQEQVESKDIVPEAKQESKDVQESKAIAPEAKQESKEIQESKVPAQESKAPAQESKAPAQVQQPK